MTNTPEMKTRFKIISNITHPFMILFLVINKLDYSIPIFLTGMIIVFGLIYFITSGIILILYKTVEDSKSEKLQRVESTTLGLAFLINVIFISVAIFS